ncbi:RagB/SusD family nutrient uptake outer membrane protein [Pedobacter sp. KBW06]|uniref:RagB/SusD family nutrient uptake outer membrane protein n=1 Tax=Pedobacter sp. KBW06 TaxID=2153359 RepID=UPI000F5913FE|nr:RagB/SusD family nutrient uptake outer membrane protein [Pedobacter sp. KBW06]RQO75629.1 RagB/SusD family nutrient uptake outer membrane protein [Pedobacter sp. KBW06]
MKKTIIILVFLASSLLSCKKYLEEISDKTLSIPNTLGDFQKLLNNSDLITMAMSPIQLTCTDDLSLTTSAYESLGRAERNAYIWESDIYEGTASFEWDNLYRNIAYANVVLEGVAKIATTEKNNVEHDDLTGQALFLRANAFYNLQELFGQVYHIENAEVALGIPLKLSTDFTEKYTRASVAQTYDQIIRDLEKAALFLPVTVNLNSRFKPSKATAYALLSRVYLSIGDYKKAGDYADKSLRIYSALTDYNTLDLSVDVSPFNFLLNEVLHYTTFSTIFRQSIVDEDLYKLYEDNDLRKIAFFYLNKSVGKQTFKGSYSGTTSIFNGIATDELLLTKSECLARLGEIQSAMNVLNVLLDKRYKSGTLFRRMPSNIDEALAIILVERRKELLFRGTRWMDLRRLNRDPSTAKKLKRTLNGKVYELAPNDPKYVFPIPDLEISLSGIPQNIR